MEMVLATIERWQWVLLAVVAVLEVSILLHALRESRERRHLVGEMRHTRVELGRESYVAMKRNALQEAHEYVHFVSLTLNADIGILDSHDAARLYRPSVRYRCITGNDPTRLREMFDLHRRGVEVRVNPMVIVSTFRFHVWDDTGAILGFSSEGDEHEIRGIEAINPHFSRVLRQHFDGMWDQSMSWQEWAAAFMLGATGTESASPVDELAEQWDLSADSARVLRELMRPEGERIAL
jgi:hypothetical protein